MIVPNKNDLMIIQNELLGDIKEVETQLNEKIKILTQTMEEKNLGLEKKYNFLEKAYDKLLQKSQSKNNEKGSKENDIDSKLLEINDSFKQNHIKLELKVKELEHNFKDATYKYDRIMTENFNIPGLIGEKRKFNNFRELLETIYKQSSESLKLKEQQSMDLKQFKEKIDSTIAMNKNELKFVENKASRTLELKVKELEKMFKDRINITEDRINKMRMENGKYTFDLMNKLDEVNDKTEKMDSELKETLENNSQSFENFQLIINQANHQLKEFEEKLNIFQTELNSIKEKIEKNKSNINKNHSNLKNKIKELEKYILNFKNKSNDNLGKDDNSSEKNKLNLKKIEIIKGDSTSRSLLKSNENQKLEEDEKNNKINNLILDAEFFGDSKKLGNSLIFQYLNDSDTIKKAKMINCKIRSGKILSHFPFISKDVTPDNKEEMKSKIFEKSDREKKDILNLLPEYITKKKKEKEIHFSFNNHYYKYLDRKIDILGKVMINNLNKIILQIYLLKNNQNFNEKYQLNPLNSIDREEKDENDNNMTFIRSILNNDFKSPGKERKESANDKRNSSQNSTSYKKINLIKHKLKEKIKILRNCENNSQN